MKIQTLITYIIASIILFLLLNFLSTKTKKITHYVLITNIYILLLAGICSTLKITPNNDAIFIVSLFELLIRIFYDSAIKETNFLKEQNLTTKYLYILTTVFFLNTFFISKVSNVFPNLEQTKMLLWLLIFVYIRELNNKNTIKLKYNPPKIEDKKEYIILQYAKLKNKYSQLIKTVDKNLAILIYAMMIYENQNRPLILRKIDDNLYKFDKKGRKFGIMQIYSKHHINDEKSIQISITKLKKIIFKTQTNNYKILLYEYYKKKNIVNEVINNVKIIKEFDKK